MFCAECGKQIPDTARFCSFCGAAIAASAAPPARAPSPPPPPPPPRPASFRAPVEPPDDDETEPVESEAEPEGEAERIVLAWENRIKILSNPAVWRGVLLAFGISCALAGIFFFVLSQDVDGLLIGLGAFGGFMVLFLLIGAVIDLFGGFRVRFALTTAGVRSMSGKGAKAAAGTAFWVGVLAGNPATAGAGLLARSEQNMFIGYDEVKTLEFWPGRRYIEVKAGMLSKPIGLYCLPENYTPAADLLRQMCPTAKVVE